MTPCQLSIRIYDLLEDDPVLDVFEDFAVSSRFVVSREEPATPTWAELLACDARDEEDEAIDVPDAMTGNDAFRIIEILKEREAGYRAR